MSISTQEEGRIHTGSVPVHIAVIMDGNGRWAQQRGAARTYGHQKAVEAVEDTITGCTELGVSCLTLYAFSIENWQRPREEVNILMELLLSVLQQNKEKIAKKGIRLSYIGDMSMLPKKVSSTLQEIVATTASHDRLHVCLAISYSGRWEILKATRNIASAVQRGELLLNQIDETLFRNFLDTRNIPDPELLIRTGGEQRISNFLLWQIAYTELYTTDILWPDFRTHHLQAAIRSYQQRERRFGKIRP